MQWWSGVKGKTYGVCGQSIEKDMSVLNLSIKTTATFEINGNMFIPRPIAHDVNVSEKNWKELGYISLLQQYYNFMFLQK